MLRQLIHIRAYCKPHNLSNNRNMATNTLIEKFGPQVDNYYAGNPLNRLAFLRAKTPFLSAALTYPTTRFLLLQDLNAFVASKTSFEFVKYDDVKPLIGNPYEDDEETQTRNYDSSTEKPIVVFLGADERVKEQDKFSWESYSGQMYFSVDVTAREGDKKAKAEEVVKGVLEKYKGSEFKKARYDVQLQKEHAAISASARSLTDWNNRNRFCASCGQSTISTNAGYKRSCPAYDKGKERKPCITREGVHNVAFPRTDPTVIMAIINADGTKMLVGRQKKWAQYMYSCLAGFLEPGESVEEAVRRETWEESGVTVGRVVIHSTQPWPFPANLMIGCIGQALPGQDEIYLKHDPELESAKWFSFDEMRRALRFGVTTTEDTLPEGYKKGDPRLPGDQAIAHTLIRAVVVENFHLAKI